MDPKKLRKRYMQILPHLGKAKEHVESQLADLPPSEFLLETNLKPYTSMKRKMEDRDESDPAKLSDLVRGRLFFSEHFTFEDALNILRKLFGKNIKKIDKKKHVHEDHNLEYHGVIHVDMDISGINFELQLMPIEFRPYKQFLHQIYEKFRNEKEYDKLSEKQRDFLRKVHNRTYRALDAKSKSNRQED
jgi:hypothetical protein